MSDLLHILLRGVKINNGIGVLKEVDNLGRLVIPKEMRDSFKLNEIVELVITKDGILIRNPKYEVIEKEKVEG